MIFSTEIPVVDFDKRKCSDIAGQQKSFTSMDLFSGCGGLTEGFRMAGIKSIFATDIDENCEKNFHSEFSRNTISL